MIREDLSKYSKIITVHLYWVHFYKNHISLIAKDGSTIATEIPLNPYDHPRMILADFESARTTLKALMKHHSLSFFKFKAPIALVQIMEPIEANLTKIEIRAFKELFFDAGMREVKLYNLDGHSIED